MAIIRTFNINCMARGPRTECTRSVYEEDLGVSA